MYFGTSVRASQTKSRTDSTEIYSRRGARNSHATCQSRYAGVPPVTRRQGISQNIIGSVRLFCRACPRQDHYIAKKEKGLPQLAILVSPRMRIIQVGLRTLSTHRPSLQAFCMFSGSQFSFLTHSSRGLKSPKLLVGIAGDQP